MRILLIILASLLFLSCKQKSLVEGFKIGMEDSVWKGALSQKVFAGAFHDYTYLSPGSSYKFYLNIGKDSLYSRLSLNGDGLRSGKLRIITISLNDSETISMKKFYKSDVTMLENEGEKYANGNQVEYNTFPTAYRYSVCPENKFKRVLNYLIDKYGNYDSVHYNMNDFDTTGYFYHFHSTESLIILKRTKIGTASQVIPYNHIKNVNIIEISKDYLNELSRDIDLAKITSLPSDLVKIDGSYEITKADNGYYFPSKGLTLKLQFSPQSRISFVHNQGITSIKGTIIVKDQYKDILETFDGVELNTLGILKPQIIGIDRSRDFIERSDFGNYYFFTILLSALPEGKVQSFKVNLSRSNVPFKLKEAVSTNKKMIVEFLPEAIRFEDGTVLK